MMLKTTEIAAIVQEIAPALVGGWIQKVFQPLSEVLVLEIRTPGQTHRLLCSVNPMTARLHLIRRPLPNPLRPPAFCQLLRARVQGARLDAIEQVPGDRILRLRLSTGLGPALLLAELFGKKPDVLLLDQDEQIIATMLNQKERIGQLYVIPPRPTPRHVESDSFGARQASSQDEPYPISLKLEEMYRTWEIDLARDQAVRERESALRKSIKKERRRLAGLQRDLESAARYESYARYGELLKNTLPQAAKGQSEIIVVDYYDERLPQITIPLDPAKSPQANMEAYFAKYRKYLTAQREVVPRIAEIENRIRQMEAELVAVNEGTWVPTTEELPQAVRPKAPRGRQASSATKRGPFRRFVSADGLQIFVGRNAQENDELTFGLAKGDDVWLHAQGSPGSHVIIRLERGMDAPSETLLEAATLALLYSDLKKSGKGEVVYTRRKWVRKARGQASGAVTITQERALHVALDKKRLEGLKRRST
jgi:predicted ribosome quality control (RQC) complex YloA/Tae2 family protein